MINAAYLIQLFILFQVAGCHAAPVGFSPSLSWQQQQVCNFSDMRQVQRNCSALLTILSENAGIKTQTKTRILLKAWQPKINKAIVKPKRNILFCLCFFR